MRIARLLEGGWGLVGIGLPCGIGGHLVGGESRGVDGRRGGLGAIAVHLGLIGGLASEVEAIVLVLEACELLDKMEMDGVGSAATVLGNNELGCALDVVALGIDG